MTYKLEPILEKITSPILIRHGELRRKYINGKAVIEETFNEKYEIKSIKAAGNMVEIELQQAKPLNHESISFF